MKRERKGMKTLRGKSMRTQACKTKRARKKNSLSLCEHGKGRNEQQVPRGRDSRPVSVVMTVHDYNYSGFLWTHQHHQVTPGINNHVSL